ncbi:protoporphyrinogen oxidase, partial [Cellulomonas bogoriensis 69B4 = DSM 16987]
TPRGLRPLPDGMTPTGPTRFVPVLRSRTLGPRGVVRAGLEPLLARAATGDDVSVGEFVTRRFGAQVCDRLVQPLLGGIHAADVHDLSLQAIAPPLAQLRTSGDSVLLTQLRRRRATPATTTGGRPPGFTTFTGGLTTLTDALLTGTTVTVRTSTGATALDRDTDGTWQVTTSRGDVLPADGVVLAVPPHAATSLLGHAPDAVAALAGIRTTSVVTVLLALPRGATSGRGTGLLVPPGGFLRAAVMLTAKWPHLADLPHDLVRLSAGRAGEEDVTELDDQTILRRVRRDLRDLLGVTADPVDVLVRRLPRAMPLMEVGHTARIRAARAALADHPGLVLAGAAYDGASLGACVTSGERAATALAMTPQREAVR